MSSNDTEYYLYNKNDISPSRKIDFNQIEEKTLPSNF